jgi:formylglycine-generating enzyme required for sulfatase activity
VARLFLSHSSRDNIQALAFKNWLVESGWDPDDVFVDLHSIGAGERWRDALRKANARCEAVILLASPESVGSVECQKELELAEAFGKEIIVAILRDLGKEDPRLARYSERQFVDLSAAPKDVVELVEFEGRSHRIAFSARALVSIKLRLDNLGIAPDSFNWPPKGVAEPEPYPGLSAFGEDDAGIFFGREADILSALTDIRQVRRRHTPRLIVIDAASGAGKSSFLRAGLWPRLKRDADFAPLAILRPAQGIITGPDGVGRRLAPYFSRFGRPKPAGDIRAALTVADPTAGAKALSELLAEATRLALAAQFAAGPDSTPPAAILAIDQGEELFSADNDVESRQFLALLAAVLKNPPDGLDPYLLVTIRADSAQILLTRVAELGLETPKALYLAPLSSDAYRDVIQMPAAIYSERVRRLAVEPTLVTALVQDATGADALPLLSFTLARLFADFGSKGYLTLAQYQEMGGAAGSIGRALKDALTSAGTTGTSENLHALIVPHLATWDPGAGQKGTAKRVVATLRSLISDDRGFLRPLVDALITARLLTSQRDTVEVAHEALLRQPPISDWLEENREFLIWRGRVARERSSYANNERGFLAGRELQIARDWVAARSSYDIPPEDRKFINDSVAADDVRRNREEEDQRQQHRLHRRMWQLATIAAVLLFGIGAGLAWSNRALLEEYAVMAEEAVWPKVLSAQAEHILKPGDEFKECADCPQMKVIRGGKFMMGSPESEDKRNADEGPYHPVVIGKAFAIGRVAVTFDEWDACVTLGACAFKPDEGWGRGDRPVVNVTWDDALQYVAWLTSRTGKPYRVLSEAEFEYAARGDTATPYPWGTEIGFSHANCKDCGSAWDLKSTAPVRSFQPNAFGLFDMEGNTWTWVQDCYHENYQGAPDDGSPWLTDSDCKYHVVRGGAWYSDADVLRSANRGKSFLRRLDALGLRVARSLSP